MPKKALPSGDTLLPSFVEHIVRTPDVCGGKPRIAGHRITVQNIVLWHERGRMSPADIVVRYPGLTLGDVYAALAYYHDHHAEVWEQFYADEKFADDLRETSPSLVQQKKLTSPDAKNDPLPSG